MGSSQGRMLAPEDEDDGDWDVLDDFCRVENDDTDVDDAAPASPSSSFSLSSAGGSQRKLPYFNDTRARLSKARARLRQVPN